MDRGSTMRKTPFAIGALLLCAVVAAPRASALAPSVSLSVGNVSHREGKKATITEFVFTVSLSEPAPSDVDFEWATEDRSARFPTDYTQIGGTATISTSLSSVMLTVEVNGDRRAERDERFAVVVSNVTGAIVDDGVGRGTIRNDD
jgi:hypothetical protein